MDIDMFYRLIHKVCLSSNECSNFDDNDNLVFLFVTLTVNHCFNLGIVGNQHYQSS